MKWITKGKKKQFVILEFFDSLKAYLELNKAGLRIGKWEDDDLPGRYSRYRLFWKDVLIRDIPDIVHVDNDWKLVNNGHVTFMTSDTIRGVKPSHFYQDEYHYLMNKLTKDNDDLVDPKLFSIEWQKMIKNLKKD